MKTFHICHPNNDTDIIHASVHVSIHDIAKDYPAANIYWLGAPISAFPHEYSVIRYIPG